MKWKYRTEVFLVQSGWINGELKGLSLVEGLDQIGEAEWELATSTHQPGYPEAEVEYVFKQPRL